MPFSGHSSGFQHQQHSQWHAQPQQPRPQHSERWSPQALLQDVIPSEDGLLQLGAQQQSLKQQPQQLMPPAEVLGPDFLADLGNLSPSSSSQLFGCLDFLQDPVF